MAAKGGVERRARREKSEGWLFFPNMGFNISLAWNQSEKIPRHKFRSSAGFLIIQKLTKGCKYVSGCVRLYGREQSLREGGGENLFGVRIHNFR